MILEIQAIRKKITLNDGSTRDTDMIVIESYKHISNAGYLGDNCLLFQGFNNPKLLDRRLRKSLKNVYT